MAKPQAVPILELGENFYDPVAPAEFPQCTPRFLNRRWAERVGLGDLDETRLGAPFLPVRAAAGEPQTAAGPALSRPPVPGVQSGHRRRARLPVRAAARRRRAPARPWDQGQRPNALQPARRRTADPEGRGPRGAGDRDAGGAGRQYVEELRAVRNRRGVVARGRALSDPLIGAYPPQPRPYPDRQFPALRLLRRRRRASPR